MFNLSFPCSYQKQLGRLVLGLCLSVYASASPARPPAAASPNTAPQSSEGFEKRPTILNHTITDTLAPHHGHEFDLTLTRGQYLQISVFSEALWLNLDVYLESSGNRANDSGLGPPSRLRVALIAPETGNYRINLGANRSAQAGPYQLRIEVLQQPPPDFFRLAKAQKLVNDIGQLYYNNRNKAKLQQMTEAGEEASQLFGQLHMLKAQADTLNLTAEAWRLLGNYTNAIATFERALHLSRTLGYQGKIAEVLTLMGMCRYHLSDYHQAIAGYREAMPIWEQLQAAGNHVLNMSGWTLTQMGEAQLALAEMPLAANYFSEAANFYHRYRQTGGSVKDWHFGSAFCLRGLGRIAARTGEKQRALDTLSEAIAHYHDAEESYYEASLLNEMGEVYASLGERAEALALYEKALRLEQNQGSRAVEAQTLYLLGQLHQAAGEAQVAARYFNQSLAIRRGLDDRRGAAAALNSLGELLTGRGEARRAVQTFEQALALQREIGDRYGEALTLHNLGVSFAALSVYPRAHELLEQALSLRRTLGDRDGEAQTLYQLARLTAQATGNPAEKLAEARTRIEAALQLTEQIRAGVLSQELRASYLGRVSDYYEFYTELLMRQHELAPETGQQQRAALHAAEMARARSLLELLAEAQADLRVGAPPDLLARERELRQRLSAKADFQIRLQTGLLPAGPHTPEQRAQLARELQTLNTEYQDIRARLRLASPRYAALTQPQPLTAEAIQQLLDADTVLLEYALGTERSFLWLVTRDAVTSHVLPPRATLNAAARRLYAALTARNHFSPKESAAQRHTRIARADTDFPQLARALSQMVLSPVAEQLGQKRLLIVAQEALQFVPFAVLPEPENGGRGERRSIRTGKRENGNAWKREGLQPAAPLPSSPLAQAALPLLAKHEISYLPSASTLAFLRQEHARRQTTLKEVAVVADPVFSPDDLRLADSVRASAAPSPSPSSSPRWSGLQQALRDVGANDSGPWQVNRLPGTRWEAEHITALVPPQQQMRALDFAANRTLATSAALNEYRIVHFATHALINTTHPALSGLVLSLVDEQGRPRDGFLPAAEIFNLNFSARLVVLSACQTGLGKTVRGEGLVGMVQSFLYAGASSVAVSLWSQQDQSTAEFMKLVYGQLLGPQKLAPAAALRAAQLEMLRSGRWPSPYFWAGFAVQGDFR